MRCRAALLGQWKNTGFDEKDYLNSVGYTRAAR